MTESRLLNKLRGQARAVLMQNDTGPYTKPSPRQYPHQWNWDSALIAIGIAHDDLDRAASEIRSLLRGQWRNGMIPQIIYDPDASGYFPGPERWRISRAPAAPRNVATSGITQPPIVTVAAWEIARRFEDTDFVRQVYPELLAYHRWLHRERDPRGEGLVSIVHPWESGLDNSPRWIEILEGIELSARPTYRRQDNVHVPPQQRPSNADYDRFVALMDLTSALQYDQAAILQRSPFVVQDTLFNSILYRADDCLHCLAEAIGQPDDEIEAWMEQTKRAFQSKLWDPRAHLFLDYDLRNERPIEENTIAAFTPLYAGLATEEQARQLVEYHLLNRAEYAPDLEQTCFRVPTASKSNRHFDPRRYWRGPIWANTNWLIARGLQRYGYHDLARDIRSDTLALVESAGFCEYFDPRSGAGYGAEGFAWTAALVIDLIDEA